MTGFCLVAALMGDAFTFFVVFVVFAFVAMVDPFFLKIIHVRDSIIPRTFTGTMIVRWRFILRPFSIEGVGDHESCTTGLPWAIAAATVWHYSVTKHPG